MQGGWAAALKKGLQIDLQDAAPKQQGGEETSKQEHASPLPSSTPAAAEPELNSKAAARQKLLLEALKSRANAVTGERWCIACGRAFKDVSRLAQHLADKHGGINAPEEEQRVALQQQTSGNAAGIVASAAQRPLQLAEVAVVKTTKPANGGAAAQATKHAPAAAAAAANRTLPPRKQPDPAAFQAPEGTRAKIRRKRPSRLKRSYNRSKAEAAVEHWIGVLAAVEEALQITGELHGALANDMHDLQVKLECHRANGGGAREASRLAVNIQILREQRRAALERVEQLSSVHVTARSHLVKSQEQLRKLLPGFENDQKKEKKQGSAAVEAVAIEDAAVGDKAAVQPVVEQQQQHQQQQSEDDDDDEVENNQQGDSAEQIDDEEEEEESIDAGDSSSSSESASGLAGFQNVLGQWAEQSGSKTKSLQSKKTVPVATTVAGAEKLPIQSEMLEHKQDHAVLSCIREGDRESSSDSPTRSSSTADDDDSDSSFGLQWGDTLRLWAEKVGADANESLKRTSRKQPQVPVVNAAVEHIDVVAQKTALEDNTAARTIEKQIDNTVSAASTPKISPPLLPQAAAPAPNQQPFDAPPLLSASNAEAIKAWIDNAQVPLEGDDFGPTFSVESEAHVGTVDTIFRDSGLPGVYTAAEMQAAQAKQQNGALYCDLCGVSSSGPVAWREHLASKRHAARLAAAGAAVSLPPRATAAVPQATGKCYVGPDADVEPYVDQLITPEVNAATEALLRQLLEWQERTRRVDPVNAKRKRRLFSGMREVEKAVKNNKAKLLIVAPNIAPITRTNTEEEEEEEEAIPPIHQSTELKIEYPIASTLEMARERNIPIVFALSRQRMGKILGARKTASAFAVVDASGAEMLMAQLMAAVKAAAVEQMMMQK